VILADSSDEAKQISDLLKEKKKLQGASSMIADVSTLHDFIPDDQYQKIRVLKEIQRLLPQRLLHRIGEADREIIGNFLTPESFKPVTQEDLPPLVLAKFTEKDRSIGKMVVVEPPYTGEDIWRGEKLTGFIREVRDTADSISKGAPVAGSIAITSDMYEAVSRDGPRATIFAFFAVVLLVVFLFRNWATVGLVLFALILGVVWLVGLILGFWIKINFLNFIALPITFGIGVDYGVNIFQRYREEGGKNILKVIRDTGGAVGLCSVTTIIGYSSLLLAGNQGFVSFGLLAVVGELTCIVAALLSLPAYLIIMDRWARKS
jgi:predicted RND superfamily exporter protein